LNILKLNILLRDVLKKIFIYICRELSAPVGGFSSTKAIPNKGFSGNSSILPRSNFGVVGQESSTQSLTAYSLNRYRQV